MDRKCREIPGAFLMALALALGACEAHPRDSSPDAASPDTGAADGGGPAEPCAFCANPSAPSETNTRVVLADSPPPPISGGTLLLTRDKKWLVASDPDRDRVHFIDAVDRRYSHTRALQAGDEPGRAVEDDAGRIHVVLRSGGAIASLSREPDAAIERRNVCALPRGLAFDAAQNSLHIACGEGELVSLRAEPEGKVVGQLPLERDLRDVIVRGDKLLITRFRSAELLELNANRDLQKRLVPPSVMFHENAVRKSESIMRDVVQVPTTAWRAIDISGKGIAILHQRARLTEVAVEPGGYGSSACGGGIVQTSVTVGLEGDGVVSTDIAGSTLAVDLAADPKGTLLVIAAPGNWGEPVQRQLQIFSLTGSSPLNPLGAQLRDPAQPMAAFNCLTSAHQLPELEGQVTAVTFVSDDVLAVQEREPAAISFIDVRSAKLLSRVDLGQASRFDTGHAIFHQRSRAGVSCASCHAEAGDDAHVWTFEDIGPRRTQSLRGGILGTEPLHWNGDMRDFSMLVDQVLVNRMSGFQPVPGQVDALARWIDRQPSLAAPARDAVAVKRGRALFESEAVGCATCHAGTALTNNQFADVGTGGMFQVPSLRGVSFRVPLMHDGCASTLHARFQDACGGANHGSTQQLSAEQRDDLVAYLETL